MVKTEEPFLKKFPAEYFGYPYFVNNDDVMRKRESQYCPYLKQECVKPRKSEPKIKVGICSIGYKGKNQDKHIPVVICPQRFRVKYVFDLIVEKYFGSISDEYIIQWASEVSLGNTGGSVDFVAIKRKKFGEILSNIEDFICVEFQANGTTGTPWKAIQELKNGGKFLSDSYPYGLNWAMEYPKTMMQQAYKKGLIIQQWNKKLVFILQNSGMDYLHSICDTSGLHNSLDSDPIHFMTFKMEWNSSDNEWQLKYDNDFSTDTEGIRKILAGDIQDNHLTIEKFIENIERKIIQ